MVTHEIGHAVGFFHEQSRSDRDDAIYINWPNVQEGFELQFEKEEDVNFGIPYDYMSVMQYPSWAFSKRVLEKNTVVTVDPKYQRLLGKNTKGLSFRDKAIMNRLYNCESKFNATKVNFLSFFAFSKVSNLSFPVILYHRNNLRYLS